MISYVSVFISTDSLSSHPDSEPEVDIAGPDPEVDETLEPDCGENFSGANSPWFENQEKEGLDESNIRAGKNRFTYKMTRSPCLCQKLNRLFMKF